jgi:hypothetical protein
VTAAATSAAAAPLLESSPERTGSSESKNEKLRTAGCRYCIEDKKMQGMEEKAAVKQSQYPRDKLHVVDHMLLCDRHYFPELLDE